MKTYETMEVNWVQNNIIGNLDTEVICKFLKYAKFLVQRGLVCNTFGNIVVRVQNDKLPDGVLYTKQRGVSLEECSSKNIVITGIKTNELLFGREPPSNGHQMSREIMRHRSDVKAVIHTHANIVCAYFSTDEKVFFGFVGNDTALVLGAPPRILSRHINLETTAHKVKDVVMDTNCIIMPNHGLVTMGRSLSEAYHRHTSFISEIQRLLFVKLLYSNNKSHLLPDKEVERLYMAGERIIYGVN